MCTSVSLGLNCATSAWMAASEYLDSSIANKTFHGNAPAFPDQRSRSLSTIVEAIS